MAFSAFAFSSFRSGFFSPPTSFLSKLLLDLRQAAKAASEASEPAKSGECIFIILVFLGRSVGCTFFSFSSAENKEKEGGRKLEDGFLTKEEESFFKRRREEGKSRPNSFPPSFLPSFLPSVGGGIFKGGRTPIGLAVQCRKICRLAYSLWAMKEGRNDAIFFPPSFDATFLGGQSFDPDFFFNFQLFVLSLSLRRLYFQCLP